MNAPLERTVLWLTWRQLFARKRIYLAIAFSLLPVIFTLVFRFMAEDREGARMDFFSGLNRNLILGTLIPLAAAVFGTTAFGGEVDDGTIVYLLVKPIARWRLVLSKYVVAVLSTIAVMIPAMVLPWWIMEGTEVTYDMLVGFIAGGALGVSIYCAIFLTLGLASKRSLILSLLYVIGFEAVLSRSLVGVKSLSVREFSVAASLAASNESLTLKEYVVPMSTVWTMGTIFLVGAISLCLWKLSRYEVAERV
ncbi:MAG: ABC transporter permease subunit [Gemmatimonadota bacterium]